MIKKSSTTPSPAQAPGDRDSVAIIGLGALFPGEEPGVAGYWRLILKGRDAVSDIPADHFRIEDYFDPDPKARDKIYARRGAFIPKVAFSPLRFGITPKDMEATDTTQLLGLVVAEEALTDAGYPADRYDHSRTSVILGVTGAMKMVVTMGSRLAYPKLAKALSDSGIDPKTASEVLDRFSDSLPPWRESSFPGLLGNVTAGRLANRLNLGGSNLVVDAACASSLAAIGQAISDLRTGRCDMAVTGGLDTFSDPFMFACFSKTPALSPTGEVRAFDQAGDGTLLGEGLGVVVLKRLADARRDADRVYAVIKSVGGSSDGKGTAIFAPSRQGQMRALKAAYNETGWKPSEVELAEAHGTGTAVGDEVELGALCGHFLSERIFKDSPDSAKNADSRNGGFSNNGLRGGDSHDYASHDYASHDFASHDFASRIIPSLKEGASSDYEPEAVGLWCALGSVKSQIGHTKAAAGAAGLIKAVLALHHQVLPPTIKVSEPLEPLKDPRCPFFLNDKATPWLSRPGRPRRASVSSFGFGGSNFHCLVEESGEGKPLAGTDLALIALSGDGFGELDAPLGELASLALRGSLSAFDKKARELSSSFDPKRPARLCAFGTLPELARALPDVLAALPRLSGGESPLLPPGVFIGRVQEEPRLVYRTGPLMALEPDLGDPDWFFPALAMTFPVYQSVLDLAEGVRHRLGLSPFNLGRLAFPPNLAPASAKARWKADLSGSALMALATAATEMAQGALLSYFGLSPASLKGSALGIISAAHLSGLFPPDLAMEAAAAFAAGEPAAGPSLAALLGKKPLPAICTPLGHVKSAPQLIRAIEEGLSKSSQNAESEGADELAGPQETSRIETTRIETSKIDASRIDPSKTGFCKTGPSDAVIFLGRRPANPDGQNLFFQPANPLASLAEILTRLAAAGVAADFGRWPQPPQDREIPEGHHVMVGGANIFTPTESRPPRQATQFAAPQITPSQLPASQTLASQDLATLASIQVESLRLLKAISDRLELGQQSQIPQTQSHQAQANQTQAPLAPTLSIPQASFGDARPAKGNGGRPAGSQPEIGSYSQDTWEILATVVSMETGYPPDSLNPDLELDNDLGLDSIKRVELLSALTERFPGLSKAGSDMGQAPTLGKLAGFCQSLSFAASSAASPHPQAPLGTGLGGHAQSRYSHSQYSQDGYSQHRRSRPPSPEPSHGQAPAFGASPDSHGSVEADRASVLLEVLAQETGYPIETLNFDLELDNDLGLDSIKRVELLSALSERLRAAPTPAMGEARTLGDLLEAIESAPMAAPLESRIPASGAFPFESSQAAFAGAAGQPLASPSLASPPLAGGALLGRALADPGIASAGLANADLAGAALPEAPCPKSVAAGSDPAFFASCVQAATALPEASRLRSVREIVAIETGYPIETLTPDLDLENDLGLDSIKKVEILSIITEGRSTLTAKEQGMISQAKTLADWEAFFDRDDALSPGASPQRSSSASSSSASSSSPSFSSQGSSSFGAPSQITPTQASPARSAPPQASPPLGALSRPAPPLAGMDFRPAQERAGGLEAPAKELPGHAPPSGKELPSGRALLDKALASAPRQPSLWRVEPEPFSPDGHGACLWPQSGLIRLVGSDALTKGLESEFKARGYDVERRPWGYDFDKWHGDGVKPRVLFLVWPGPDRNPTLITQALRALESGGEDLESIVGLSFLGGNFGFPRPGGVPHRLGNSISGALVGLLKCAAREWPKVSVRALDIPMAIYEHPAKSWLLAILETAAQPGPVELGLPLCDSPYSLALKPYLPAETAEPILYPGDTVVATGGGRGVTAIALLELARLYKPRLVILGRTPLSPPEPDWLAELQSGKEIKAALHRLSGEASTPRELEARSKLILSSRELRGNLAALEAAGSQVEYISGDFTKPVLIESTARQIRHRFGPIKGLIHGAGILADHPIKGKSQADFARVFATKTVLAQLLLEAFQPEPLKLLVFFSSSTARFGRQGQADYAAGNEVLNKTAWEMAMLHPHCRVLALNWGPWAGGMVGEALAGQFKSQGVGLIGLKEGAETFAKLIKSPAGDPAEVIVLGPGTRIELLSEAMQGAPPR